MMRVRPTVSGSLQVEGATFVELDRDHEWPDDHPLVARYPECFERVPAKPKTKAGG